MKDLALVGFANEVDVRNTVLRGRYWVLAASGSVVQDMMSAGVRPDPKPEKIAATEQWSLLFYPREAHTAEGIMEVMSRMVQGSWGKELLDGLMQGPEIIALEQEGEEDTASIAAMQLGIMPLPVCRVVGLLVRDDPKPWKTRPETARKSYISEWCDNCGSETWLMREGIVSAARMGMKVEVWCLPCGKREGFVPPGFDVFYG